MGLIAASDSLTNTNARPTNTHTHTHRPFKPFNPIRGDEVITIYADKDYKKLEQVGNKHERNEMK